MTKKFKCIVLFVCLFVCFHITTLILGKDKSKEN